MHAFKYIPTLEPDNCLDFGWSAALWGFTHILWISGAPHPRRQVRTNKVVQRCSVCRTLAPCQHWLDLLPHTLLQLRVWKKSPKAKKKTLTYPNWVEVVLFSFFSIISWANLKGIKTREQIIKLQIISQIRKRKWWLLQVGGETGKLLSNVEARCVPNLILTSAHSVRHAHCAVHLTQHGECCATARAAVLHLPEVTTVVVLLPSTSFLNSELQTVKTANSTVHRM